MSKSKAAGLSDSRERSEFREVRHFWQYMVIDGRVNIKLSSLCDGEMVEERLYKHVLDTLAGVDGALGSSSRRSGENVMCMIGRSIWSMDFSMHQLSYIIYQR